MLEPAVLGFQFRQAFFERHRTLLGDVTKE